MSFNDGEAERMRKADQESFKRWSKVFEPKPSPLPRYPTVEPKVKIHSPNKPEKKKPGFLAGLLVFGFLAYMVNVGFQSPQNTSQANIPAPPQWAAPQPAPKNSQIVPKNLPPPAAQPKPQSQQPANTVPGVRVDMSTMTAEVVAGQLMVVNARWFQTSGEPVDMVSVDLQLKAPGQPPQDLPKIELRTPIRFMVPIPSNAGPGEYQLLAKWNSPSGRKELALPFAVVTTASANPPAGGSRAYGAIGPD